jgi:predicted ATP-dependent endonuclease of OLD family
MKLKTITIRNFRRLKKVQIDLDNTTSIFVGSNNSGKTSATYVLEKFLGQQSKGFSIHDFSSDCWKDINKQAQTPEGQIASFPSIGLDLWFDVAASDLHRVIDLLPSLDWKDQPIGVRIEYCAKNPAFLLSNFREVHDKVKQRGDSEFHPWPKSLTDYLTRNLKTEYELRYYVLDRDQFDEDLMEVAGYKPMKLGNDTDRSGAKIVRSLVRIDLLNAQRYLEDQNSPGRAEDLSKRMNRFYERNLEKRSDDYDAMQALARSENELTKHLQTVFDPTLKSLNKLGYPGFNDPRLEVRASLNYESIAGQTKLHYSLGNSNELLSLPDRYNGLGFKNLIYMVIEILDFHARWEEDEEESRPPLHLIIIEEPEAHLHAQLQQVFIKKIWEIIVPDGSTESAFKSQMIVTTHSPHIIYESGFQPIRYFQRCIDEGGMQTTDVLNLTTFYNNSKDETREFLQRYMKLTHCDLFFADAAILVEGNVERLLLPLMINKSAPALMSSYLTIMEIGGAFGHLFRQLIEFLGLTTLVITDLDSVQPPKAKNQVAAATQPVEQGQAETVEATSDGLDNLEDEQEVIDEEDEDMKGKPSEACMTDFIGAVTSNQTLIKWMPKLTSIDALLATDAAQKIQNKGKDCNAHVYIAYQTKTDIEWYAESGSYAGRTLEESFALENVNWTQDIKQRHLGLRVVTKKDRRSMADLRERLFRRVNQSNFNKTDFALGLMLSDPSEWTVPTYICEGLSWLAEKVVFTHEKDTSEVAVISVDQHTEVQILTSSEDEQESK